MSTGSAIALLNLPALHDVVFKCTWHVKILKYSQQAWWNQELIEFDELLVEQSMNFEILTGDLMSL